MNKFFGKMSAAGFVLGIVACSCLFSGCFTIRDTDTEWRNKFIKIDGFSGPASEDAELVDWQEEKWEVDHGGRMTVGVFPGLGEVNHNGTFLGKDTKGEENLLLPFFYIIPWGWLVGPVVTSWSCFVTPFVGYEGCNEVSFTSFCGSFSIFGCHKWKTSKDYCRESMLKVGDKERVVRNAGSCYSGNVSNIVGKSGDDTTLLFDYPGFSALFKLVDENDEVDVMFKEGGNAYRRFRVAEYVEGALIYEDVRLGEDKVADAQILHQRRSRSVKASVLALKNHRGYPYATDSLKSEVAKLSDMADIEVKLTKESGKNAVAGIENSKRMLENRLEEAYQNEVARVRKEELARIASQKTMLDGLLASRNFKEVVRICDDELSQKRAGWRSEDVAVWMPYKEKASKELEAIRLAEEARLRKIEEKRIAERKVEIEKLLASQSWQAIVDFCREEYSRSEPGCRYEDREIWEPYERKAQSALDEIRWQKRKIELEKKLSRLVEEKKQFGDLEQEFRRGSELIDAMKGWEDKTSLQKDNVYERFRDKRIAITGEIQDVGDTVEQMWGKKTIYVSLKVKLKRKVSDLEAMIWWQTGLMASDPSVNIKFMLDEAWKDRASYWSTGQKITLNGIVSSRGDLFNQFTIRDSKSVTESDRNRAREIEYEISAIRNELDSR